MLKRVKIQGYKSLVDVEVNLQPLSVLFGPNASGKSNFLDALQLLSRIATSNNLNEAFGPPYRGKPLESFTFGPDGIRGLRAKDSVSFTLEIDVELSQSVVNNVNGQIQAIGETAISAFVREKYLRYRIEIERLPKTATMYVANEYFSALNPDGALTNQHPLLEKNRSVLRFEGQEHRPLYKLNQSIFSMPLYLARFPYLAAMREELANWFFYYLEPRERMRIPDFVKEVRHIGLMGEELAAFLNTLQAIDEKQFKAVENALHMIIPSITAIDVSVNNSGDVELSLLEGNIPIPIDVVSDGTLRILGLLALGGAKEPPALLGIEEPENGIHQRRLRLIASLLKNRSSSGTQVIVTTHSPLLVDLIPHECLYVCRKPQGGTVIEPLANWELLDVDKAVDDEDEDLTVSERIQRGDFDV